MHRLLMLLLAMVLLLPASFVKPAHAQGTFSGSFFWEDYAFAFNYPVGWGNPTPLSETRYIIAQNPADEDNPDIDSVRVIIEYFETDSLALPTDGNTFVDLRDGFSDFARTFSGVDGLALTLTINEQPYGVIASTAYRDDLNTRVALVIAGENAYGIQLSDPNGEVSERIFSQLLATVLVGEEALTPPVFSDGVEPIEIAPGGSISGTISDDVPEEIYVFQAPAGMYATITMTVDGEDPLDPLLVLYADRSQIGYNNNALDSFNALIANVQLPPARFYIITATRRFGAGSYSLTVSLSEESDPTTWLGPISYKGDMPPDGLTTDALNPDEVGHAWRIEAEQGQRVTINLDAGARGALDPVVVFFDASGNLLASNDDVDFGVNFNSEISSAYIPQTGEYFVVASSFGASDGDYELRVVIE